MAEKKYYWLKMTDQFFEDKAIKKLRKIAGGDTYTIIYLKMLLTAIKQGNKMYFEGIEDDFMEELALELDEDTDNVKVKNTENVTEVQMSPEETKANVRMYEDDILGGLMAAAAYKTDMDEVAKIQIIRHKAVLHLNLLFLYIHSLSGLSSFDFL